MGVYFGGIRFFQEFIEKACVFAFVDGGFVMPRVIVDAASRLRVGILLRTFCEQDAFAGGEAIYPLRFLYRRVRGIICRDGQRVAIASRAFEEFKIRYPAVCGVLAQAFGSGNHGCAVVSVGIYLKSRLIVFVGVLPCKHHLVDAVSIEVYQVRVAES